MATPFKRIYLVTVEGDAVPSPLGCGSAEHEQRFLNSPEITVAFGDAVERFYQTTLLNGRVTVEPVDTERSQTAATDKEEAR